MTDKYQEEYLGYIEYGDDGIEGSGKSGPEDNFTWKFGNGLYYDPC